MHKKSWILLFSSVVILITGCGTGDATNTSTNYYSASANSYYQIESSSNNNESTTYTLSIITTSGDTVTNIPLTTTSTGYTFSSTINGVQSTGTIVISGGQMGLAINSTSSYANFATTNSNRNAFPSGTYTTI